MFTNVSERAESPPSAHEVRRRPTQARSRERFDKVLNAASELVAERGLEPIRMTDIAEAAGMPLTALYRYFPNKQAIVRELALGVLEADSQMNMGNVDAVDNDTPVDERIRRDVAGFCRHQLDDPVRMQIRAAIHADTELSQLDLDDSRRNAALIAASIDSDDLGIGRIELERRALVIVELLDGIIRLAHRLDADEASKAIEAFAQMSAWSMLRPDPRTPASTSSAGVSS